jgi:hypothetical protein
MKKIVAMMGCVLLSACNGGSNGESSPSVEAGGQVGPTQFKLYFNRIGDDYAGMKDLIEHNDQYPSVDLGYTIDYRMYPPYCPGGDNMLYTFTLENMGPSALVANSPIAVELTTDPSLPESSYGHNTIEVLQHPNYPIAPGASSDFVVKVNPVTSDCHFGYQTDGVYTGGEFKLILDTNDEINPIFEASVFVQSHS